MKRSTLINSLLISAIAACGALAMVPAAHAQGVTVNGYAGVRVWVDGGDVFPAYNDVNVYLRADRDCYTTLLLVDTAGYVHVLYPTSPRDRAWMRGGRTYHYSACDLGLDRLDGVGVAHLYAVASPVPFDYSAYGVSVFVGGFGFRVYGDPYIACREFYASLLPVSCRWDFVGVSCARFYVHQWVRYPSYLCAAGPGFHVRVGDGCRECAPVYASYRSNVANPNDALRPTPVRFKSGYASQGQRGASAGRVAPARAKFTTRTIEAPPARVERVKVVSTSGARAAARASVKTSERKFKSGTAPRPAAGSARVTRQNASVSTSRGRSDGARAKSATRQKGATKVRQAR